MTPRHLLLRALRVLAALVLLVVVLRAVVVPLARQRQHRRVEAPTLLALLPACAGERPPFPSGRYENGLSEPSKARPTSESAAASPPPSSGRKSALTKPGTKV